jgi:hypothetical protein
MRWKKYEAQEYGKYTYFSLLLLLKTKDVSHESWVTIYKTLV